MITQLEGWGGSEVLSGRTTKKTFFAASLTQGWYITWFHGLGLCAQLPSGTHRDLLQRGLQRKEIYQYNVQLSSPNIFLLIYGFTLRSLYGSEVIYSYSPMSRDMIPLKLYLLTWGSQTKALRILALDVGGNQLSKNKKLVNFPFQVV